MDASLEEKLSKIDPKDYTELESAKIVSYWKDRVPELAAQLDFKNHPITRELADAARGEIERIEGILKNNEDITELERKVLFREKKTHDFYLKLFTPDPSAELASIERAVDLELDPE